MQTYFSGHLEFKLPFWVYTQINMKSIMCWLLHVYTSIKINMRNLKIGHMLWYKHSIGEWETCKKRSYGFCPFSVLQPNNHHSCWRRYVYVSKKTTLKQAYKCIFRPKKFQKSDLFLETFQKSQFSCILKMPKKVLLWRLTVGQKKIFHTSFMCIHTYI